MELNDIQKKALREIGTAYNLRYIILHGSYAKRTPRQGSDLDMAILGKSTLSFEDTLKIHGELAKILGDNRERELDLKTLHGVDSLFRYEVVRYGKLLYGDASEYEEFKAYAYRDYMDSYDLRELELGLLKKSIQALAQL